MTTIIRGSTPRTFAASNVGGHVTRWYGRHDCAAGEVHTVADGQVLVVPEHGAGLDCLPETRRIFAAGTRFRILRHGSIDQTAVTEIL